MWGGRRRPGASERAAGGQRHADGGELRKEREARLAHAHALGHARKSLLYLVHAARLYLTSGLWQPAHETLLLAAAAAGLGA